VNWESLYCPNQNCKYYGIPYGKARLGKNGTSYGQKQAQCKECGTSVSIRYGTAYYRLKAEEGTFETAIRALAEGCGIRSTGRIVEVDKDTVCDWLNRAAAHCRIVILYLFSNLHFNECQLDELWSFVHTKEKNLPIAKLFKESYGEAWVWLAFAPEYRLIIAFVVGKRTQESANLLLERVKHVSDECIPFFTSDQLPAYPTALIHAYGEWRQPQRQGRRGPYPKPRKVPPANLYYAQVVKKRENGCVVEVSTKPVFGHPDIIQLLLANSATSDAINTSFVERQNLTMRQLNRRLTRKTNGFSKELPWFEKQLWLSIAYYHFVLPHDSLKLPLFEPLSTKGPGSPKKWAPVTPAMKAGITDHVWTLSELLSFRVPAAFLDSLDDLDELFPQFSLAPLPEFSDDVNFYCDL
jgi:IS1 family transposase/transposase-like protein